MTEEMVTLEPYGPPDEPVFPLVLVDDDQWLDICETAQELDVEPDFLDDIEAAFDALARPLELFARDIRKRWGGQDSETAVRVCGLPLPNELQGRIRDYFALWTYEEAPAFEGVPQEYIAAVKKRLATAQTRKKKVAPGS
ncbi:hypothetical protein ABR738_14930 [Streptomyces sp. Edi4]|uniref:hypothetical protein n=1 Tax=Streptomyces sp. Edi4 TaxID=3162527 RepID=UPI003305DB95